MKAETTLHCTMLCSLSGLFLYVTEHVPTWPDTDDEASNQIRSCCSDSQQLWDCVAFSEILLSWDSVMCPYEWCLIIDGGITAIEVECQAIEINISLCVEAHFVYVRRNDLKLSTPELSVMKVINSNYWLAAYCLYIYPWPWVCGPAQCVHISG